MKVPVSWLRELSREFVDVPADPKAVASKLAACGFAVESIDGDVIDFEITANRPDCMSVLGLAREAAVAFGEPGGSGGSGASGASGASGGSGATGASSVAVSIDDAACGRYALVVADVKVAPSPSWLADRLTACGIRPINNVVDISNYVMLEMGHPTHAFDLGKLAGPEIRARLAKRGEKIKTLDGQTRTLDASMLVIADRDRAVAIGGVMGGADSEVSSSTTKIAFESAWFAPASVRMTGRKLGLKTEASARFERGADINGPPSAIARAMALLEKIGAGRATGPVVDVYPALVSPRSIGLRRERIARLLGDQIPDADIARILTGLGFQLAPTPEGWSVLVPSYRVDALREVDLIEEVGRHWGFDRIPESFPALRSMPREPPRSVTEPRRLRALLTGAGLQEACTFTFMDRAAALPFATDDRSLVAIQNPLSEKFSVLRPSLLPGLIDSLIYSRRRDTADVRLFESGSVFSPAGEAQRIAYVLTGPWGEHWSAANRSADFFDAQGIAAMIAGAFGLSIDVRAIPAHTSNDAPGFERGRIAQVTVSTPAGAQVLGVIGQIRPDVLDERGLGAGDSVYAGELDLELLLSAAAPAVSRVEPLPRFPSIVRDLSIFVDERLPAANVRATISAHAPSTLVQVREFDRYQGKGVPAGQISVSLRLTFRSTDRTLTDADVQHAVATIVAALAREHGATLRGGDTTISHPRGVSGGE